MNLEVKGVHYNISDATMEFLEKKLERISFAKDNIVDLLITVTKEKQGYSVEGNVHFRWGKSAHLGVECHELYEGIEVFIDKLDLKVRKEKSKIKSHV
ncbi:MAG: ribosome-associated translation inhibitor RaiA [Spirochaetes bacterium]|nr:MAG: ribosome-associated translation inhibitor RaiA [Spirochaetota bacterium]